MVKSVILTSSAYKYVVLVYCKNNNNKHKVSKLDMIDRKAPSNQT